MKKLNIQSTHIIIFNRLIFVLSIIGFLIAIYVLQSFIRQTPIVCVNSGCELVRKNPASFVFGIPIPAFGLVGYFFLSILAFMRTASIKNEQFIIRIMLAIATFGVGFVTWFTYTEIFVIQAICTWCAISASIMLAIFTLTLVSVLKMRPL